MSFTYNGTEVQGVTYNGNEVQSITYNGVEVWSASFYKVDSNTTVMVYPENGELVDAAGNTWTLVGSKPTFKSTGYYGNGEYIEGNNNNGYYEMYSMADNPTPFQVDCYCYISSSFGGGIYHIASSNNSRGTNLTNKAGSVHLWQTDYDTDKSTTGWHLITIANDGDYSYRFIDGNLRDSKKPGYWSLVATSARPMKLLDNEDGTSNSNMGFVFLRVSNIARFTSNFNATSYIKSFCPSWN